MKTGSFASFLLHLRNRYFLGVDILMLLATPALAFVLRTDANYSLAGYWVSLLVITLVFLWIKIVIFYAGGLYKRLWLYAATEDHARIVALTGLATCLNVLVFLGVLMPAGWVAADLPRSIPILARRA